MYISPINFKSQAIMNNSTNTISMRGKKIPTSIDTRIYDTFLNRLENLKDVVIAEDVKVFTDKNYKNLLNNTNDKTVNLESIANELQIPAYKISASDFVDKESNKELIFDGANYIETTLNQLRNKFIQTGERSILLFENIDEILKTDFYFKIPSIIKLIDNPKMQGILPIFTVKDSNNKIVSPILNRLV